MGGGASKGGGAGKLTNRRRLSMFDDAYASTGSGKKSGNKSGRRNSHIGGGGDANNEPTQGEIQGGKKAVVCNAWFGCCSRPGNDPMKMRKENQDCFLVEDCFAGDKEQMFFMVCDGHGPNGAAAATFSRDCLSTEYIARDKELKDPLTRDAAIAACHTATQEKLTELEDLDSWVTGTSAVTALLQKGTLWVANLGDCRAMVGRKGADGTGGFAHTELTQDHKPERQDEADRIVATGGRVFEWGVPRVWLKDVDMPGLSMTRSFGDQAATTVGVISVPEVRAHDLVAGDQFLLMASDGIWEFMSNEEAVQMVGVLMEQGNDPQAACSSLVNEAVRRWKKQEKVVDDITVVVAYLGAAAKTGRANLDAAM